MLRMLMDRQGHLARIEDRKATTMQRINRDKKRVITYQQTLGRLDRLFLCQRNGLNSKELFMHSR